MKALEAKGSNCEQLSN